MAGVVLCVQHLAKLCDEKNRPSSIMSKIKGVVGGSAAEHIPPPVSLQSDPQRQGPGAASKLLLKAPPATIYSLRSKLVSL